MRLNAKIPCCGGHAVRFARMAHATIVERRTCPTCTALWQVVIAPLTPAQARTGVFIHKLDWVCLRGAAPRQGGAS